MFLALAGGFLSTESPGKSTVSWSLLRFVFTELGIEKLQKIPRGVIVGKAGRCTPRLWTAVSGRGATC